jgi:hypothetical protein
VWGVSAGSNQERIARALVISGVATIVVAVVLAVAIDPVLGAIALLGIVDFVLARMFASGRLGSSPAAGAPADPTEDPSYNPYARED